ncbi:Uncharacterised protein [Burkholderia pseudomallei]|nr:Uncharacterised protein [Burkholderia pseudomallei]
MSGGYRWKTGTPMSRVEYVRRVEVYRPGAETPCLAITTDGDKNNSLSFNGSRVQLRLRIPCPAFCALSLPGAPEPMGIFDIAVELAETICNDAGEPTWTYFTATGQNSQTSSERNFTLEKVCYDLRQADLGNKDIFGNYLKSQLLFKSSDADPATHLVDLRVRAVRDSEKVPWKYLLGFAPRTKYSAKLEVAGVPLGGSATSIEWVQPAEDLTSWSLSTAHPLAERWLAWLHGLEGVEELWNRYVHAPYMTALAIVSDAQDASFLPAIQKAVAGALSLCLRVDFKRPGCTEQAAVHLLRVEPLLSRQSLVGLSFEGLPLLDSYQGRLAYEGQMMDADLGGSRDDAFDRHYGAPREFEGYGGKPDSVTRFRLRVRRATLISGDMSLRRMRFGALDLSVGPGATLKLDAQTYVSGLQIGPATSSKLLATETRTYDAELADVVPGAEDPAVNATQTELDSPQRLTEAEVEIRKALEPRSALIIPAGDSHKAPALLEAQEQTRPGRNRSLVLRLRQPGSVKDTDRSVLYLSTEPFLVAKVNIPALEPMAGSPDEIANWSLSELEGSKWELAAGSGGFELMLPPQAIGEAMEKCVDQPVIVVDKPIDYRFSAPARMQLQASWFMQGYAEAPWNLSRVLGYPGQRAPGARVNSLSFELVYGITTTVDASRVSKRLSLAEMFSRLGAPAPVLERAVIEDKGFAGAAKHVFLAYRARWAQTLRLMRSRLAVLELYAPGDVDARIPQPFALSEGVTAYLREGAYKRMWEHTATPPTAQELDHGADMRYPIHPSRRPQKNFYEQGMAGGFAWPFESHTVFQGLLRDPVSNEASVSNLRFSALGAWGDQRASFDNKRTKIITSTAMGRLARITVERVGRIGVFWNRSKHVIVYERTVLPTRQFQPSQLELGGRPVLRKVEEYVEILQPERHYPEFGAVPQSCGFVEATHFVTLRILVDSHWGMDGPDGLEIPLWNPDADSRIYPRPSVFLVTSGDKQGQSEFAPREISEPDRLFFFSATAPDLDDRTDLWPAYQGVDYDNTPSPQPETCVPMDPHDADAMLPDVVADLPGWRRFTFPFADAAVATNIVASRSNGNAMNACLTHVCMMRAAPARSAGELGNAMAAVDLSRAVLSQLQQNVTAAIRAGLADDELTSRLMRELMVAASSLAPQSTTADVKKKLDGALDKPDWLEKGRARIESELRANLQRQSENVGRRIHDLQGQMQSDISAITGAVSKTQVEDMARTWCSTLSATVIPFRSGYERLLESVNSLVSDVTARSQECINDVEEILHLLQFQGGPAWTIIEQLESAREELRALITDIAALLPADVPPLLQGAVANVRAALCNFSVALEPVFDNVEAAVAASDPWFEPEADVFEPIREQVFGDPDEPYVEGETTLATPLKLLAQVKSLIDVAIKQLLGAASDVAAKLASQLEQLGPATAQQLRDSIDTACAGALKTVQSDLASVLGRVGDAAHALTDGALQWQQSLPNLSGTWAGLQQQVQGWRNELEAAGHERVDEWLRGAEPKLREAFASVETLYGRARSLQQDLGQIPSFQDPTTTLRLIRAVGEGPLLPEMTFNRERMAYFFDDYAAAVRSSPVAALVNRVGDDLKALGLRLPTQSFLERIIPAELQNFDFGKILPDFSALKNSALFERIKCPAISNDTVHVTQGFDEVNRAPWLKANIDIPINERSEAFRLGPLGLILPKADFYARAEMTFVNGAMEKTQEARVTADWLLEFGGAPLVTFEETVLEFSEGGNMRFNIRPDRIRLDAALEWLSDLMEAYEPEGGSGLHLELVYADGRPVGAACTLAAALPPIGTGVFAVSGVQVGAGLTLGVDSESGEFAIGVMFNASRKIKPFTLTIAFLNGGGWIESQARYLTNSRQVVSQVSIGIVAGAGVEFALGPCAGSVYVQFGIFVEFSSGGGGQTLSIGIMLLVRGSVVVFSIATVSITLLLQAVYRNDGSLTGYGSLSVTIRVSQFLKLSFSSQVTYNLRGGSQSRVVMHSSANVTTPKGSGQQALAAAIRHSELFQ